MSTVPVATQVRRPVTLADGSVQWEIATQITDQGDLPFPELFVVSIVNPLDPKEDVLAHVATPQELRQADPTAPIYVRVSSSDLIVIAGDTFAHVASVDELTALPRDRVVAVNQGVSTYLVSAITLTYDSVTTANAAYLALLDRLSALVTDWRTATSSIVTNPSQSYNLPTTTTSVQTALTNAYLQAVAARKVAEAQRDAAKAAADACVASCEANKAIYAFLTYDVAFLQFARAVIAGQSESATLTPPTTSPSGQVVTVTHVSQDYVLQRGAFSGDATSYQALLGKKLVDQATYQALVRTCDQQCAALQQALLLAQAAVNAAKTAETNALGAVLAVCPTYVPPS